MIIQKRARAMIPGDRAKETGEFVKNVGRCRNNALARDKSLIRNK